MRSYLGTILKPGLNLPVVGESYFCFHDGKIKPSRRIKVTITALVPFNEIDQDNLDLWKDCVEEFDWIYAKETDYFAKGSFGFYKDKIEETMFVRDLEGNWYGLENHQLDLDGSLNQGLEFAMNN